MKEDNKIFEEEFKRKTLMCQIKDEILEFKESPLYKERIKTGTFPIIGEGSHFAKIIFIGEAPGKNEAMTGRPFCGAAGKILDELLEYTGIDRKSVYITNIVKDRPPKNRDPSPAEIEIYAPFLDRQIKIIQPKVIATLGRFSMAYILKKFQIKEERKISQIHGMVFEAETDFGEIKIIPLYHPAVAVYNRKEIDILKKDFTILKKF